MGVNTSKPGKDNQHDKQVDFPAINAELKKTVGLHQAGNLKSAEALYLNILEHNPTQPDVLHLLGVIAHQGQDNDEAEKLISRAIQIAPDNPCYFNSMGTVYKAKGKLTEALGCFNKAIQLNSDYSEAYFNLGRIFHILKYPNRLIFADKLPINEHLARLRYADLALDTRIVNGAITTSDALWSGVPVLSMQGSHFASRMSSSILSAIGLPEMIVHCLEQYESLAVGLSNNACELKRLREKLENNRNTEPLFDITLFVKHLENAYVELMKILLAGEEPKNIEVIGSDLHQSGGHEKRKEINEKKLLLRYRKLQIRKN